MGDQNPANIFHVLPGWYRASEPYRECNVYLLITEHARCLAWIRSRKEFYDSELEEAAKKPLAAIHLGDGPKDFGYIQPYGEWPVSASLLKMSAYGWASSAFWKLGTLMPVSIKNDWDSEFEIG